MTATANLGLVEVVTGAANKEVSANQIIDKLDAYLAAAGILLVTNSNAYAISATEFLENSTFTLTNGSPAPTGALTITVPVNQRGIFCIRNSTAYDAAVGISGQSLPAVTLLAGTNMHFNTDGVNVMAPPVSTAAGGVVGSNGWSNVEYHDFSAVTSLIVPIPPDAQIFRFLGFLHMNTTGQNLLIRFSTDGGATFDATAAHYSYAEDVTSSAAGHAGANGTATAVNAMFSMGGGANNQSAGIDGMIFASQEAGELTYVKVKGDYDNSVPSSNQTYSGGFYGTAAVATHVQILSSSGTISGRLMFQKLNNVV